MKIDFLTTRPHLLLSGIIILLIILVGCKVNLNELLNEGEIDDDGGLIPVKKHTSYSERSEYYEKFYIELTERGGHMEGTSKSVALDKLPKGQGGEVNWTTAVMEGLISPRGSIEPGVEEMPPLDLNIFIEAKVPLMSNVLFPHSIHTYWLSCDNCHPKIFIPKAGGNPDMTMDDIFKGEWCGKCHGKVAFNFFPIANCRRCHVVMKGDSLDEENWN